MAYLPGKFARFRVASTAIAGPYRWNIGFRRERLDTTTFESEVSFSENNVHSDGMTGVLDTTFQVETLMSDVNVNIFFPESQIVCDLYYRKLIQLGHTGLIADVLELTPSTERRGIATSTAQLQTSGLVAPAA